MLEVRQRIAVKNQEARLIPVAQKSYFSFWENRLRRNFAGHFQKLKVSEHFEKMSRISGGDVCLNWSLPTSSYMKETAHDAVMERVDSEGRVIGFSILGVSRFTKDKPLEAELTAA